MHIPTLDKCDFSLGKKPHNQNSINGHKINATMTLHAALRASASAAILAKIAKTINIRPDDLARFYGTNNLSNGFVERCAIAMNRIATESQKKENKAAISRMYQYERSYRLGLYYKTICDLKQGKKITALDEANARNAIDIEAEWKKKHDINTAMDLTTKPDP